MSLCFYNTLTREKEVFNPLKDGIVRMYTCGPTVYNYAHIGNFRAYIFEDILRRYLEFKGYKVIQVMNLTDVDDKTIKGAIENKLKLADYTKKFKEAFFEDIAALRIRRAEYYPCATEHIAEMIKLIQILLDKGYAYKSEDGSIYFSIAKFPDYGKLAHLKLDELKIGARVKHDEYQKDNLADFALWKAYDENDGDVFWEAPFGRGRPGWHIECSAMSMKYLGETFDIHTGGIDNIFPHHEDEIAQSEAATGKPFVRYWLHCGHLIVEGRKMSKSFGNFYTLRDLFQKGYSPREIRYVLLNCHYRQSLDFTFKSLDSAKAALQRVDEFMAKLKELMGGDKIQTCDMVLPGWAKIFSDGFNVAMDDDLNVAAALGAVFDLIREGNKKIAEKDMTAQEASAILAFLQRIDEVFAVFLWDDVAVPAEIIAKADARLAARRQKNFAEADRLRKEIEAAGWQMQDTADGYKLRKKS